MLNLRPSEKQRRVESHAEREAKQKFWREHGLDILQRKNPTYSECKAAAIGNQSRYPELAEDLMVKARKWKKPK